jgi:lysozyme
MRVRKLGLVYGLAFLALVACGGPPASPPEPAAKTYPKLADKLTAGALLEPEVGVRSDPVRTVSVEGLRLLKEHEGYSFCSPQTAEQTHCPYNDSSDFCTIGHGHLIEKKACADLTDKLKTLGFDDGISQDEADLILIGDLAASQVAIERQIDPDTGKVGLTELTDEQYDALVSLAFNIGGRNFSRSTLLKKLQARAEQYGDVDVAGQFLVWNRSNGAFVQGLLNRRNKEVDHFFTGFTRPVVPRSDTDGIDIRVGEP